VDLKGMLAAKNVQVTFAAIQRMVSPPLVIAGLSLIGINFSSVPKRKTVGTPKIGISAKAKMKCEACIAEKVRFLLPRHATTWQWATIAGSCGNHDGSMASVWRMATQASHACQITTAASEKMQNFTIDASISSTAG